MCSDFMMADLFCWLLYLRWEIYSICIATRYISFDISFEIRIINVLVPSVLWNKVVA